MKPNMTFVGGMAGYQILDAILIVNEVVDPILQTVERSLLCKL